MEIIANILFFFSTFIIFWAMAGYPLSLIIISKFLKIKEQEKDYSYEPTVTVMVVAHNEEKVIREKLDNREEFD